MSIFCINTRHPRFQTIVKQTELPVDYVMAVVSAWMEENQSEEIPSADVLGLEVVNINVLPDDVAQGEEIIEQIRSKVEPKLINPAELDPDSLMSAIINGLKTAKLVSAKLVDGAYNIISTENDKSIDEEVMMIRDFLDKYGVEYDIQNDKLYIHGIQNTRRSFDAYKDYLLNDHDFDGLYESRRGNFDNFLAPNGNKSRLFETLMDMVGNEKLAKRLWMSFYSPEFRQWFGDWVAQAEKVSPTQDEKSPTVILPIGISGSGKSTWIKSLPVGNYTIISPDEIRKEITGSISDQSRNREVFEEVDRRIFTAIANGEDVILDATNLNTKLRREFIDKVKKQYPNTDLAYKIFEANPEISKERIKKDLDNKVDRSAVPAEVIDRQMTMYTQALQDIQEEGMRNFDPVRLNDITNPVYSAVFFNTGDVVSKYNQVHPNLFSHHSTIEFKPADISTLPIGQTKDIKIVGRLTTDKVDALIVENPLSKNKFPHITLSTAEGVKPFQSNAEIENNQDKIQPLDDSIEGVVGVFDGKNEITAVSPARVRRQMVSIKPGVEELFNSTPELANQVYEALGLGYTLTDDVEKNIRKTDVSQPIITLQGTVIDGNTRLRTGKDVKELSINSYSNLEKNINKLRKIENKQVARLVSLYDSIKNNTVKRDYYSMADVEVIESGGWSSGSSFTNEELFNDLAKEIKNSAPNKGFVITPQQKQQALQFYSQYLDTIFPDSKVKDIVYHDGGKGRLKEEGFKKEFIGMSDGGVLGDGFYFYLDRLKRYDENRSNTEAVILNAKNLSTILDIIDSSSLSGQRGIGVYEKALTELSGIPHDSYVRGKLSGKYIGNYSKQLSKIGIDSVKAPKEIMVLEPEQIHILGSKQDIKGFKSFVEKQNSPIKDVSQIVDENGEPMLVFDARTNPDLDAYTQEDGLFKRQGGRPDAQFFTTRKPTMFQEDFKGPFLLNIKNGLTRDLNKLRDQSVESNVQAINETNQDGVVIKQMDGEDMVVTFKPEQVKSAYNRGGFKQDEGIYFQMTPADARKRDQELDKKIQKFLDKIGVSVTSVNQIKDRYGNSLNATAKADMLGKIIEVVNDRAAVDTLPEEAAHFFVEMLGENHPLYKRMFNRITDFDVYRKTVEEYRNVKSYRNEDGTINVNKMKKEAIGKAIAQHIIDGDTNEQDKNLNFLEKFWADLLNLLKSVFGISEDNPFMDTAQMILDADISQLDTSIVSNEEYFNQQDPLVKLMEDQQRIQIDNTLDPLTNEKRHVYFKDGVPAKHSVTSYYVEPWLKKIFRGPDMRDDVRKLIDIAKADYGDLIHLQIQEIIRSLTKADGTRQSKQGNVEQILPGGIFKTLNDYVMDIMDQYEDPATVFLAETRIFDSRKKIGGTIDLLVVEPTGKVHLYDWKSQEIYKNQDDLKPYKEKMYKIQLEEYIKILKKEYGFSDIGTVRAIPIKTVFTYKDNQLYNLNTIEIGDIDPEKIPDEKNYLLPVVLNQEPTGDEQLDNLITQLNAILEKYEATRYSYKDEEVYKRKEEINRLRLAIRDLQLRKRIDKLVVLGLAQYKKYKERLENKELTGNEIRDSIRTLEVFSKSSVLLYDLREEQLANLKENRKDNKQAIKEFQDTNRKFLAMKSNIAKLIEDIKKYQIEMVQKKADEFGIKDIMEAEEEIGSLSKNFQALSNINRKLFRTFSRVLSMSQQKRDIKTKQAVKKLAELKENFTKWASEKGMSMSQAIEMMLNLDAKGNWNGNFLPKIQAEYYKKRTEAVKTGDLGWLIDNSYFDEEAYEESLNKQIEMFKSIQYEADDVTNEQVIKQKIQNWIDNHNAYNSDGSVNIKAYMNIEDNYFLKANDKWQTEQWKKLFEQDSKGNYINKPAVDAYNYFQHLSWSGKELGMIDSKTRTKFIPSMFATNMENIAFGDVSGVLDANTLAKLEVDSGTQYTPEIDPSSGEIINRIPVYFTKDIGVKKEDGTWDYSKKSRDLFKVFGIWAGHMYNYEAMSEIEDTALSILDAEKSKGSLVTDQFGNIAIKNNRVKKSVSNDRNAAVLEDFVNYYLYDRQSGDLKDVKFRNRVAEKFKKFFGKEEQGEPKEYSLTKTVQTGMNYFGIKTLALNLVSSLAQLVGGGGNVLFQALKGKMFTTKIWGRAVYAVMTSKKARAALEFMDIAEGTGREGMFNQLSLVAGDRVVNKHNAFILQRLADKSVTQPVVVAMMMEHMLDENNNVISISNYLKEKYKYNETFYNLSSTEREALQKKINDEFEEISNTKSLLAIGKMNDKNEFSIDGMDENNQSFIIFKQKIIGTIKKVIGNTGRDDVNNMRTGLLGSAMMQFRSWIPEMMEDRFDGLKYDDELQTWTYGRWNLFFRELLSKNFSNMIQGIFNGFGGTSIIERAKELYLDKKAEMRMQDKEFDMTEAEFIDMYIGTMRSMIGEFVVVLGVSVTVMSLSGGDDREKKSGLRKLLTRAFKKFNNEFTFYLNPTEFTKLLTNPLPFLGLTQDFSNLLDATRKELVGGITDNDELQKKAKPMKYFYKMFPIGKEALIIMSAFDDDFRKEYDIRLDNYFYK